MCWVAMASSAASSQFARRCSYLGRCEVQFSMSQSSATCDLGQCTTSSQRDAISEPYRGYGSRSRSNPSLVLLVPSTRSRVSLRPFVQPEETPVADRILKLTAHAGNYEANVDIRDDPGPLNTWISRTEGAWASSQGTFTNAANTGKAKGCGVIDCWTLYNFDFDVNVVGDAGDGVNADATGDFPVGELQWEVIG